MSVGGTQPPRQGSDLEDSPAGPKSGLPRSLNDSLVGAESVSWSMRIRRDTALYRRARAVRSRWILVTKRLSNVDRTAYVHVTARVSRDLRAAEYVFVGRDCEIAPYTTIGRYSMLASRVCVVGDDHVWDVTGIPIQFTGRPCQTRTSVEADVWIGHGAIVLRGVTIGRGSVVGAGSVVTKDIPAYEVWAGVPARRIGMRLAPGARRDEHDRMLRGPVVMPRFVEPRIRYGLHE
jgi:acetyltransferase-like isoleucine patch superfamily enzyme